MVEHGFLQLHHPSLSIEIVHIKPDQVIQLSKKCPPFPSSTFIGNHPFSWGVRSCHTQNPHNQSPGGLKDPGATSCSHRGLLQVRNSVVAYRHCDDGRLILPKTNDATLAPNNRLSLPQKGSKGSVLFFPPFFRAEFCWVLWSVMKVAHEGNPKNEPNNRMGYSPEN